MLARTKAGHAVALHKAQLQVGAPPAVVVLLLDLLRQRHPGPLKIPALRP